MISPLHCDFTARSGRFYQPSLYSDEDFLNALVLHQLSKNVRSQMSPSAKAEDACVEEIELRRKFRANMRQ